MMVQVLNTVVVLWEVGVEGEEGEDVEEEGEEEGTPWLAFTSPPS
jgi:hypothetical protein